MGFLENKSEEIGNTENTKTNENTYKFWSTENTLLLISIVKDYYEQFSLTVKKKVWEKVAVKMSEIAGKSYTSCQCETKWKTLKRTYKSIVISNKTSGQKRRYWEFFNVMNDILFDKPEINPLATCSSLTGIETQGRKYLVL